MKRACGATVLMVAALATGVWSSELRSAEGNGSVAGSVGLGKAGMQSVVYLEGEGLAATGRDTVVIDQIDKVYTPHLTTVPAGTTINFLNSDPFLHNVYCVSDKKGDGIFNYAIPHFNKRGEFYTFNEPGLYILLCNVHPEMEAFIVVTPTPYAALTDLETGAYRIDNVPPGEFRVRVWKEKVKKKKLESAMKELKVVPGETSIINF